MTVHLTLTSRVIFDLLMITSICTLLSCTQSQQHELPKDMQSEVPGEWMYNQRVFPFDHVNNQAIAEAVQITKEERQKSRGHKEAWLSAGPINIGGRVTAIALHPNDQKIMYLGGSVGGVWKSEDSGVTWDVVFEEPGALSIGSIAISRSNPEIIYVGTGEANSSSSSGAFFATSSETSPRIASCVPAMATSRVVVITMSSSMMPS